MTPKAKAKELIDEFLPHTGLKYCAAKCALIACDEIIKALRKDLPEIGLGKGYWYDVKTEIENL